MASWADSSHIGFALKKHRILRLQKQDDRKTISGVVEPAQSGSD